MKQPTLFLIYLLQAFLMLPVILPAQSGQNYRIDNSGADTVFYCREPVAVAPGISIENISFETASDGIKISIVNYREREDLLKYTGTRFAAEWNGSYGNLELKGQGTAEEYEAAVRQVVYENLWGTPVTAPRSFSISLLDADYLPQTEHFYLYIAQSGITWTDARDAAASMNYYGLQGYLATITSAVENDFIWAKLNGMGWIGASDAENEGTWMWVTGPEAGTVFWQGNYAGYKVNGEFSYWNTGEPNNANITEWGEDYAHIYTYQGSIPRSWNDLPNEGNKSDPTGVHYPRGYVVEFGGMTGDPDAQLSASAVVAWSVRPDVTVTGLKERLCGEFSQQLHLEAADHVSTVIRSVGSAATVDGATTADPVIQLPEGTYGTYRFELEVTDPHSCSWYDTITVRYQHQPVAEFQLDEDECAGYNLQLQFTGEVSGEARFDWFSNDTLYISGMDVDSLEIPLGFGMMGRTVGLRINEDGCTDSLTRDVTVTPVLDFHAETPEGCSPLDVAFISTVTEPIASYHWDFGDGSVSTGEQPVHTFINNGLTPERYDVSLRVVSAEGCENRGVKREMVTVLPAPQAAFYARPPGVLIIDPVISFENTTTGATKYSWDFGDGSPFSDEAQPVHRYDDMGRYTVLLHAENDFGCMDTALAEVSVSFDRVYPPNAFSPHAEKEEDREFRISADGMIDMGYRLLLFNRWGQIVFESRSQDTGWDGRMKNGNYAPAGVYTWVLEYTDLLNEKHVQQGTVTLIL